MRNERYERVVNWPCGAAGPNLSTPAYSPGPSDSNGILIMPKYRPHPKITPYPQSKTTTHSIIGRTIIHLQVLILQWTGLRINTAIRYETNQTITATVYIISDAVRIVVVSPVNSISAFPPCSRTSHHYTFNRHTAHSQRAYSQRAHSQQVPTIVRRRNAVNSHHQPQFIAVSDPGSQGHSRPTSRLHLQVFYLSLQWARLHQRLHHRHLVSSSMSSGTAPGAGSTRRLSSCVFFRTLPCQHSP